MPSASSGVLRSLGRYRGRKGIISEDAPWAPSKGGPRNGPFRSPLLLPSSFVEMCGEPNKEPDPQGSHISSYASEWQDIIELI